MKTSHRKRICILHQQLKKKLRHGINVFMIVQWMPVSWQSIKVILENGRDQIQGLLIYLKQHGGSSSQVGNNMASGLSSIKRSNRRASSRCYVPKAAFLSRGNWWFKPVTWAPQLTGGWLLRSQASPCDYPFHSFPSHSYRWCSFTLSWKLLYAIVLLFQFRGVFLLHLLHVRLQGLDSLSKLFNHFICSLPFEFWSETSAW